MRTVLLVALLAAAPSPALADDTTKRERQFIDETHISLPRSVGVYALEEAQYDPQQWAAGVSGLYHLRGGPRRLALTLFVYPQGEGDEAKIVDEQIHIVEQSIRAHPDYAQVKAGPLDRFAVALPRAKDAPQGEAATETIGRRQVFNGRLKGEEVRSIGFVFHRHLHNIKLRITVPADAMAQTELETLADAAARALVPAVAIENFGSCGDVQIALPEKGKRKANADDTALQLVKAVYRVQQLNCASEPGPETGAARDGFERRTIEFPAGTWKSS